MGKIENMWSHSTKSRSVQRKEECWEVQKKNHQKKRFEEGLKSK